jgi:hypothetical protein
MQGFICSTREYEYEGWFFEFPTGGVPWPLRQDGEHRARAGRRFWDMIARFYTLSEAERETYRRGGGCVELPH